LNLYRKLIHLRASNSALAVGELVPLTASNPAVAAYLRRDGSRVALVVANLGKAALSDVAVGSAEKALGPGRYTPRSLLGSESAPPLVIGPDGRLSGYVAVRTFAPTASYVFDLSFSGREP
jgi:glycosidase